MVELSLLLDITCNHVWFWNLVPWFAKGKMLNQRLRGDASWCFVDMTRWRGTAMELVSAW